MATKLPSGNYRTQVLVGYEKGKRKYKSFTAETAKKADLAALQWQADHPFAETHTSTLSASVNAYIHSRTAVLSPSTIRAYNSIRRSLEKDYAKLCRKKIDLISADDLQTVINDLVYSGHSAKTCRNWYGFLSAVFASTQTPIPPVKLPPKVKGQLNIPDAATLKKLFDATKDTELEIPVLLAAIGPMRRGEIVAASVDDLKGNVLHVHRSAVLDSHRKMIIKEYPKTYESTRDILLPEYVANKIREQGYVCNLPLDLITSHFRKLLERCGIEHFRFHDLRHAFVSICHAAGIPDAYIQQRGGWASNYTMNNVYRHTLSDVQKKESEKINGIFDGLF